MAISIGDLVANIDADTSGLQRGLKQAETQISHLGRAFKTLESGILVPATAQFKRVEQAAGSVVEPIAKVDAAIKSTTATAARATPAINSVRAALGSMAAQAIRVPGPVGAIAGQLGSLALGSLMTAGIFAGITGVTLLIHKLGEAARKNKKLVEEFMNLDPTGVQAQRKKFDQLNAAYERRAKLQKEIGQGEALAAVGITPDFGPYSGEKMTERRNELARVNQQIETILSADADARADKLDKHTDALEQDTEQITKLAQAAAEAARAIENMMADAMFGMSADGRHRRSVGSRDLGRAGNSAQLAEAEAARAATKAEWKRRNTLLPFGENLTAQSGATNMAFFAQGANKFADAVDGFGNGVKTFFKSFGDFRGMGGQLGANLTGAALGFVADKVFGAVSNFFKGTDRIAEALERNTRALEAGADFIAGRVSAAGMSDEAKIASEFVEAVLNRVAVGDIKTKKGRIVGFDVEKELEAAGLSWEKFLALADVLGVEIEDFSVDQLRQFAAQIGKTTTALSDLTEELSNAPAGFKIALDRYNATTGVMVGAGVGGMAAGETVVQNFAPGAINIDAKTMTPREMWEAQDRETLNLAARGGATARRARAGDSRAR